MFKLQRLAKRSSRSRERFDFRFSNFQALQVSKGWDRLFVSLISVETGKIIAKLNRALVRNGSCQWREMLSESFYISRDDSSKGDEGGIVKLVLTTGSTRYSILGEAIINVAEYAGSRTSAKISLPLKKSNYGTVLELNIECLTPRANTRYEESKYSNSQIVDHRYMDSKSNGSDCSTDNNVRFLSEEPAATSGLVNLDSEEEKRSASASVQSFDSPEGYIGSEYLSTRNTSKTEEDISHSYGGSAMPDYCSVAYESQWEERPSDSEMYFRQDRQEDLNRPFLTSSVPSRNFLEVAEDVNEELRAEAKMWERNARKLMLDLDISQKKFSGMSKKQAELEMELLTAHADQENAKKEMEEVKLELQKLQEYLSTREDPVCQSESMLHIQKAPENEIKDEKHLNDDLKPKQRQESNINFPSIHQKVGETIKQNRGENENHSSLKLELADTQSSIARSSEDNRPLLIQQQQLNELEKELQAHIKFLEEALREKIEELENEQKSNSPGLFHVEKDYMHKVSMEEGKATKLDTRTPRCAKCETLQVLKEKNETNLDLIKEIELLREKLQELENDCAELTAENLELLFKLKDFKKGISRENPSSDLSGSDESEVIDPKFQVEEELKKSEQKVQILCSESSKHIAEIFEQLDMSFHLLGKPSYDISYDESETGDTFLHGFTNTNKGKPTCKMSVEYVGGVMQEMNKVLEMRIAESDSIHRKHYIEINDKNGTIADTKTKLDKMILEFQELERLKAKTEEYYANTMEELDHKRSEINLIQANLMSKAQQNDILIQRLSELEAEVSELQLEKINLEHNMDPALMERITCNEYLVNPENVVAVLHPAVNSDISDNINFGMNSEERERHELNKSLSGVQEENMYLKECISGLETQVRLLEDEKEFCLHGTDILRSVCLSFQDEVTKLKMETEIQILGLKQILEDMLEQWLGVDGESRHLKGEIEVLQLSAVGSRQETMRNNQELHENYSTLATQLRKSRGSLSDCAIKVEFLDGHLTSVLEDFAVRENGFKSDIDALILENSQQNEKLVLLETLHQAFLEKAEEFEKEVEHLNAQLIDAHKDKQRISLEACHEISLLLADKARLKASLHESELKVRELTIQIAASIQSHERLMLDQEKTLKILASYKKSEEKLKSDVNELEVKLTMSSFESQELTKDMGILMTQLHNISCLHDEIPVLKRELEECQLDKDRLELELHTVSEAYKNVKEEKVLYKENISAFQDAMPGFEGRKWDKVAPEGKLVQMEKDLADGEILRSQIGGQEVARCHDFHNECPPLTASVDPMTEKQLLDNEFCEGPYITHESHTCVSQNPVPFGKSVARERYDERTNSSLETELHSLRERYLEMSLKYAEVEAQREELVMKLKETRVARRWFGSCHNNPNT